MYFFTPRRFRALGAGGAKNKFSTLMNFNFRSTRRIFLLFFFVSKWIFEADSNLLSEMTAEFTGTKYPTKTAGGQKRHNLSGPQ